MNDLIIDPLWFYWLEVIDTAKHLCMLAPILALLILFLSYFLGTWSGADSDKAFEQKMLKRVIIAAIVSAVIFVVGMFIPSEKTLIKMKLAEFTTKSNVETILETIDDKTDKLIDALRKGDSYD